MAAKILVLEDDLDFREALVEVLGDQGYQVTGVGNGPDAIRCASEAAYDLIVSDIRMPGMDGLEAIEKVKQQQPEMSTLVVSGYASEEETLRAVRLNVGGYLKKPFQFHEFLKSVKDLLARRAQTDRPSGSLRTLGWAVDALAGLADDGRCGPPGTLRSVAQLADGLAGRLGLSAVERERTRVQTLLDHLPVSRPDWLAQEHPWLEDPLSRPAAIASLCRQAHADPDHPELRRPVSELAGQFPPELLDAYGALDSGPLAPPAPAPALEGDPGRIARTLLGLAQTFEQGQDLASARQAYQEILSRAPEARETVWARLGLAGLALREGNPEAAARLALEVPQPALAYGPVTAAAASFQSGLLLFQAGSPESRSVLEEAARRLNGVGLRCELAQSCVLLTRLGSSSALNGLPQALATLEDPSLVAEVTGAARWLIPALLELALELDSRDQAAALRLALAHPLELSRTLARNELSREGRALILDGLERSSRFLPEELVQRLAADPDPQLRERALRLQARSRGVATPPMLRLLSLGHFQVYLGEDRIPDAAWKSQKVKYLLAYLLDRKSPVSEDQVLEEFWPEAGQRTLHDQVYLLRRCLRPPGKESAGPEWLIREREQLGFNREAPYWYDVEEVEKSCEAGAAAESRGQQAEALAAYRRVAQLYTGPYLEGAYYDFAVRRRDQLEASVTRCLSRLAYELCQSRHYQEALEHSTRALAIDPHLQEGHLYKMRAHLGLHQPEAAVRQFSLCERVLKQEYGLEPNLELLEVCLRARNGLPDSAAG